ncbi:MAG TPA: TonB-dependent receptor [Caulobacteraceae bacterium]|jgi:iron complex outermembrane receptor protein|nr:TonB-dependent receptor [Caulobacteraceae bacterium]
MKLSSLFVGVSCLAFSLAAAEARAQAADSGAVEQIVVTGSHIMGTAKNTTVAVDVIGAEDLRTRGSPSPIELMKSLPYVSGGANGENNYGSQSTRYAGAANINLRGLSNASTQGFDRTLVLFNGQRIAPYAIKELSQTDINMIPMSAVGRVETLKNGGSTAYGSDAIAGVVNFITATNLNGLNMGADYQYIQNSGGNWNAHANWGKTFDRGNILLSAGYNHTSQLKLVDRSWAIRPLLENPQQYTVNSNPGPYTIATAAAGLGPNKTFLDPGCTALGGIQSPLNGPSGAPVCYMSRAPYYNFVDNNDRVQLYGELNYKLTDTTKLHLEGWWTYSNLPSLRTSPVNGAPAYYPTVADEGGPGVGILPGNAQYPAQATAYYIPASNPGLKDLFAKYTPAQMGLTQAQYDFAKANGLNSANGWQALGLGGQPGEGGQASYIHDRFHSMRVSAGLEGLVLNDIHWNVHGTFGQYDAINSYPDTITQRLELALRGLGGPGCNPTSGQPGVGGCQYFNPFSTGFGANGSTGAANAGFVGNANDPKLVQWMRTPDEFKSRSRLATEEAGLSGDLHGFSLPGGPISWAAGIQHRWYQLVSDPQGVVNLANNPCTDAGMPASSCAGNPISSPVAVFGAFNTLTVSQSSTGEYLELRLPILPKLELQVAGRHEGDSAGNITNDPKVALRWQATDWLAFRGSKESTFHAPLPLQLDTANPYTNSAAVGQARVRQTTVGNPNLKPETSTNYDFGIILTPGRLTATVDYWSYKLKNPIGLEGLPTIISALFPNGAATNGRCNDPAYAGVQSHFEFNGACSFNNVSAATISYINGPTIHTAGIDFDITYKQPLADGLLTLSTNATWLATFRQADQYLSGSPLLILKSYQQAGNYNGGGASAAIVPYGRALPRWRAMASINYATGPHNIRWISHYVSGVRDNRFGFGGSIDPTAQIPGYPPGTNSLIGAYIKSSFIHDISYSYTTKQNWELTVAVTNIFDRPPPFARTEISFAQDLGSAVGRVVRFGVQKTF